jgi:hypothetical protein
MCTTAATSPSSPNLAGDETLPVHRVTATERDSPLCIYANFTQATLPQMGPLMGPLMSIGNMLMLMLCI